MRVIICLLVAIGSWFSAVSQVVVSSDISVNTEWNADTIHVVQSIYVYANATLTIKPGVVVEFDPSARLVVQGAIIAQGLPSDSIQFTARDKGAGWLGIAHYYANQPSKYQYCSFSHAVRGWDWDYQYRGSALSVFVSSNVDIENSLFRNNSSQSRQIICLNNTTNVAFRNNTVRDNTSQGDGVFLSEYGSPVIEGNYITRNFASSGGGISLYYSPAILTGNIITNNRATTYGGGIYIYASSATLTHNVIAENQAQYAGGGIYSIYSPLEINHNTIVGNQTQSASFGAGIYANDNATLNIRNTILYANGSGAQIALGYYASVTLDYVNIQGGTAGVFVNFGLGATVNNFINQDPHFVDRANGDYRLSWPGFPDDYSSRSGCIDAGDPYQPRDPDGSVVDLGAFYFPQTGKNFPPRADFYAEEVDGYKSLDVQFFNTSVAGSNSAIDYHWDFGDGETSDDPEPIHEFKGVGQFDVSLTATDANGLSHTFTRQKLVTMHSQHYLSGKTVPDTLYNDGIDYLIGGNLQIPTDKRLVIEAGVKVIFMGQYTFEVFGSILAVGNAKDSITFTYTDTLGFHRNDYQGGWFGIRITPSFDVADSTILEYCRIEFANSNVGAIYILNTEKVRVSNCFIHHNKSNQNGGGILVYGSNPKINNNVIAYNKSLNYSWYSGNGGGIYCDGGGNPTIVNNFIYNNEATFGAGVYIGYNARAFLINNVISYNRATWYGGGIMSQANARYTLVQNTIINNTAISGGGAYFDSQTSRVDMINCIFADNNSLNVSINSSYGELGFRNCIVEGGRSSIATSSRTNIFYYIACIDSDPALSTNIPIYGGRITSSSPARDKGYAVLDGLGIPPVDILGNERIKSGTIDIGAIEYTPVPPPQLLIPELTFNVKEDFTQLKVGLDSLFSFEMGNHHLQFGTTSSDDPKSVNQISGQTLVINGLANLNGADSLYVRGSNGDEEVACLVRLNIEPVNDPPVRIAAVGDMEFDQDFPTTFFNLNDVFTDIDSDISGSYLLLENSVIESISAFILDDKLTIVSMPDQFGQNTLEFSATDGEYTLSESMKITVREKVITGTDAGSGEMFSIYPNPTSSAFQIRLPADVNHTELTDSTGKVLPVTTDRNDQFVIYDLRGYSPGVYFIHVFSPHHKRVLKVVKI